MSQTYEAERANLLKHFGGSHGGRTGRAEEIRTTPLFSLEAKFAVEAPGGVEKILETRSRGDTNAGDQTINHVDDGARDDGIAGEFSNAKEYPSNESQEDQLPLPCEFDGRKTPDPPRLDLLSQYALLGNHIGEHTLIAGKEPILMNTRAPNSVFICGSQGSGKSFTLSCILENCLLPDTRFGAVADPVAGVAFHYDLDGAETIAEVASLCSRGIKVKVLLSNSNYHFLAEAYSRLEGAKENLTVGKLLFEDHHLSIERMHKLMAFSESEGNVPLYMEVVQQILRKMAIQGQAFSFIAFERDLAKINFLPAQSNMLNMRMNLLKSFLAGWNHTPASKATKKKAPTCAAGDIFTPEPGTLTIIDLTDPFLDPATVCVLFDVCLGLVKQSRPTNGMVITLDEAHKYLNKSAAAANFTDRLLTTIREQRHNATRVIVATQEPTVSDKLLDICSVSIVHRFTSPAWFAAIKDHLSGASAMLTSSERQKDMLEEIVNLGTGESFVFSPSALLCRQQDKTGKLGSGFLKMKTRMRLGVDSGTSKLAGEEKGAKGMEGALAKLSLK